MSNQRPRHPIVRSTEAWALVHVGVRGEGPIYVHCRRPTRKACRNVILFTLRGDLAAWVIWDREYGWHPDDLNVCTPATESAVMTGARPPGGHIAPRWMWGLAPPEDPAVHCAVRRGL